QRTLNAFTFAKPNAWTGNVHRLVVAPFGEFKPNRESVFKSVHAGAIRRGPALSSGTVGEKSVSPIPNVMFPFEFKKNPFHTQVPNGPPNTNSNPPNRAAPRPIAGLPRPSESSPRFGGLESSPPAT